MEKEKINCVIQMNWTDVEKVIETLMARHNEKEIEQKLIENHKVENRKYKRTPFKFVCLTKEYSKGNAIQNYIEFMKDSVKLLELRNINPYTFLKTCRITIDNKMNNSYEKRWESIGNNLYIPTKINNRTKKRHIINVCNNLGLELKNLKGEVYNKK
jgi:hypothetical protein